MNVVRSLLRPGWLLLAVVVFGFAAACFLVLAPWQLGKNTDTEHRNDRIRASTTIDPVPVERLHGDGPLDPEAEWRSVTATGTFLPGKTAFVRLRSVDGSPAYQVLAAFRTDDGRVRLVERGYARPVQGTDVPPVSAPPSGTVTITARLRADEGTTPGRPAREEAGHLQVYSIDSVSLAPSLGERLTAGYLEQTDGPGVLGVADLPQLESGPYLSYGLQWLAFGTMAPLGLAYLVWNEIKARRKGRGLTQRPATRRAVQARATRTALRAASTVDRDAPAAAPSIGDGAASPDDRLHARYGR